MQVGAAQTHKLSKFQKRTKQIILKLLQIKRICSYFWLKLQKQMTQPESGSLAHVERLQNLVVAFNLETILEKSYTAENVHRQAPSQK